MKTKIIFLIMFLGFGLSSLQGQNLFKNQSAFPKTNKNNRQWRRDLNLLSLDTIEIKNWDNNSWGLLEKHVWLYNTYGLNIAWISYSMDLNKSSLDPAYKHEYTYNTQNLLDTEIFYRWNNSSQQWKPDKKYAYTYDNHQNISVLIRSEYEINQFVFDKKTTYTYDANQKLTQENGYEWDATQNDWIAEYKTEYTYDTNGNLTDKLKWVWDTTNNQWVYNFKWHYDINNTVKTETTYSWDTGTNIWTPFYQEIDTYDSSGKLLESLNKYWDQSISDYVNDTKTTYTYDTFDNITEIKDEEWRNNDQTWHNDWRSIYTYDNTVTYNDLLLPYVMTQYQLTGMFNHKMLSIVNQEWDENTQTWENDMRDDLIYHPRTITGIDTQNLISKIYPNPVANTLFIEMPDQNKALHITIYDGLGKMVLNQVIVGNHVNVNTLPSGIYYYKISGEHFTQSGKIIKK